ncbi:MAG: hypothetical protein ACI8TP_003390 [Acidimicrobiales bacterium]|jgi:uncharacterized protein (TIGR00730 family)
MSVNQLTRVCVYCASSPGSNQRILEATDALADLLVEHGIELVYGGGAVGLMGRIADRIMAGGGRVTGVLPTGLFPLEVGHIGISELIEVDSMHDRKAEMFRLSDGFIALPGGFGTLEEMAEVLTWAQLGMHAKPIGLLNIDGFYDGLLSFFDRCVTDRLLKDTNRSLLIDHSDPSALLDAMFHYDAVVDPKWLDAELTQKARD